MDHCRGPCWVGSSGRVSPLAVQFADGGAVAGRSGATGLVRLGRGECRPQWLAVACGWLGGLVRALELGLLGAAACGARECCRRVAWAWAGR